MTRLKLQFRNRLLLSCTLFLIACSKAPPVAPTVPPLGIVQVQDFVRDYVAATNSGDATKITSMIAKDPDVTSVAYGEVFRGWDAIRKEVDDHIATAPGSKVTFATVSVQQLSADVAVASAPFTLTVTVDGKIVQLLGAASIVVRRGGEQLLIVHEHYSLKHE